jgi:hypothetical protein
MKKIQYCTLALLLLGLATSSYAQREGRESRNGNVRQERVDRSIETIKRAEPSVRNAPNREPRVVREANSNIIQGRNRDVAVSVNRREEQNNNRSFNQQQQNRFDNRNANRTSERAQNFNTPNNNRVANTNNVSRVNNVSSPRPYVPINANVYHPVYNYYNVNYHPDYRRPYSYIGVRYTNFFRPRVNIFFGGANYYYSAGFFYSPFNDYYQVVAPPVGIHIWGLPWGYKRFYIGLEPYYYFSGTYYRYYNNYYEVVDAPLGSILPELPQAATAVVIDGHKYHQLNGTFYQETLRGDETWYTVVGKNGKLNTQSLPTVKEETNVSIGDVVNELPDGYKTIVLNNQKYYVANDVYYQENIMDNNIYYKVVAKP